METATTNPYTINGLEPSSGYDFYVRANCGGGDLSEFSTKTTAATACALVSTMPFTEDFDGYPGVTTNTVDVLPYCWSKLNTGTTYPGLPNIYASATYAASGSNSLHFYTSSSSAYADQTAVLPQIDITTYPINSLQLTMDVRASSSTSPFVLVVGVMTDPTNATTFTAVDTIDWQTLAYTTFEIPLSHYAGTGSYIAVMAPKPTSGTNYGYVDNVVVDLLPTCPIPRHLTATNVTTTSIELSWDEMGTATNWDIEYGPMGFTPGHGTVETASSNPYTINGLNHSTGYDFYIRANCGSGDVSNYTKKITIATACAPYTNLPFMENFDAYPSNTSGTTSHLPYCWSNISTSTSSSYAGYPIIYTSATYAASGNNSLRFYTYYYTSATSTSDYGDQTVILPEIDITTNPINTLQLSMDVRDNTTSYAFQLIVGVMTDTTFTPVDTINTSSTTYANYIVDFSNYNGNGNRIAMLAKRPNTSGSYNYGYVDNIIVEPIPACQRPSSISAVSTTSDTVFLSWTDSYGSLWDLAYGPIGFDPDNATEATLEIGIDTNAFTVTGLSYGTGYEFYVRSDCGGAVSAWVMNPAVGYPYTYVMGISGSDTLTSCGIFISDNGGPNGDYANSCNYTLVVFPSETDSVVSISGTFDGESTLDYLSVYNGVGTDDNNLLQKVISGATGNVVTFGPLNSTTGPLTLLFHSDGSVVYSGFVAAVTCVPAPTCRKPNNLAVSNISQNSVSLSWTAMGGETDWDVIYGAPGFNPESAGTLIQNVGSNPYTLTGLTALTAYEVYVRANCGSGDVSDWIATPVSFNTAGCDVSDQCQYVFNCTDNYGDGWNGATINVQQNGVTVATVTIDNGSSYTANVMLCDNVPSALVWTSGNYDYECSFTLTDPTGAVIYTSSDLTSGTLYSFTTSCSGATPPTCNVPTNLNASATAHNAADVTWTAGGTETSWNLQYRTGTANWTTLPVNATTYHISGLAAQTTYEVRVQANCGNNNTSDWTATVSFTTPAAPANPCNAPTNLQVNSITQTSATITWTAGGNENAWNVQYKLQSSQQWQEANVQQTTYTIEGLTANSTYDVRVKAVCAADNQSDFVSTTFTTTGVGIDNITLANSISLMPNPADNYIELRINSNVEVKEAVVYNAFGQTIQTVQLTENHARIDLSNMATGMYFVRVNGEGVTATKKFIKR